MARKLLIDKTSRLIAPGVAVLDTFSEDDKFLGSRPIFDVVNENLTVVCGLYAHNGIYPLQSEEDIEINEKQGTISFTSRGKKYVIRAFNDSDRKWFLKGTPKKTASAEQMEKMFKEALAGRYNNG